MSENRTFGAALGTLWEGISIAWDAIIANKIRAGLTILGVGIGVSVVVIFAALITGVRTSISDAVTSAGPDNFQVVRFNFTGIQDRDAPAELASASLYNLALCKRLLGQMEEARADLESYRAKYGDDERTVEVACQLADIHAQAGREIEAITELRRSLAAEPPRKLLAPRTLLLTMRHSDNVMLVTFAI